MTGSKNKDNKKEYDLNVMTGEVIKCTSPVINGPDSTNPGERKIYTGTVVGAIEEPLLDMDDDSRTGRQFSDITQIVAGTDYIKIENQHDLYEAVSMHRHKTILVYAIVCIMGCVLLVLNVIMIVYELLIICGAGLISGVGISMCVLSVILRKFS